MTIYNQLIELLKNREGEIFTQSQVRKELNVKFGTNKSSVLISDFCYNYTNKAVNKDNYTKFLFQKLNDSTYCYLGENYPFNGEIFWIPKHTITPIIIGEWKDGQRIIFNNKELDTEINDLHDKTKITPNMPVLTNTEIFDPFKSSNEIKSLIKRADDYEETYQLIEKLNLLKKERDSFYLTQDEFIEILKWKLRGQYQRTANIRLVNTDQNIRIITNAAFLISHCDEEHETIMKLNILKCLGGVEIPVASAVLALCYPEQYAVIDFRGWRQIYRPEKKKSSYSGREYMDYLAIIKKIATKYNLAPQEVDMAIWQKDMEEFKK